MHHLRPHEGHLWRERGATGAADLARRGVALPLERRSGNWYNVALDTPTPRVVNMAGTARQYSSASSTREEEKCLPQLHKKGQSKTGKTPGKVGNKANESQSKQRRRKDAGYHRTKPLLLKTLLFYVIRQVLQSA